MIKVSVIIPSYNSSLYYKECIESVLHQSEREIEIIPVDACSTDGTWELIKEYAEQDNRIRPMRSEEKSYGYQCNLGIRLAKGKYIAIVESDDFIAPDMLFQLYEAAEMHQADWVKADFDFFADLKNRLFLHYQILPSEKRALYGQNISLKDNEEILFRDLNLWNGIYRKEFLIRNQIVFNETKGAAYQDISFVLQTLMTAEKFLYLHGSSYFYRQDNQASSIYNPNGIRYVKDEFEFMIQFLDSHRALSDNYRTVVLRKLFGDFTGAYVRLPHWKEMTEQDKETVKVFRRMFCEQYEKLPFYQKMWERMPENLFMDLLMNSMERFDFYVRREKKIEQRMKKMLIQFLQNKEAVIAGAGEYGSGLYAFLKNNKVEFVKAFCDNNECLEGRCHMGLIILSMEEACQKFKKAIFLVANHLHNIEIQKQLISLGILQEQIIRSPHLSMHAALEETMREE